MTRGKGSIILSVAVLGGAFLAGFLAMTTGAGRGSWAQAQRNLQPPLAAAAGSERLSRSGGRESYVVLTEALPAHPDWQELTELTAEVEREQQSLVAERAAVAAIAREAAASGKIQAGLRASAATIDQTRRAGREETRAALRATYARRWETEQARIAREAERQLAERRAVLSARVDEKIGVRRGELKAALATRSEQIRRQREARLLSLQLQLGLKDKDPAAAARADSLQEELGRVQAEIDQESKAAQRESETKLAAYAREVEETAARDLQAYADQLAAEAARQAEATRLALDEEEAARLSELEAGPDPTPGSSGVAAGRVPGGDAVPGSAAPAPTPLQLRRNALQASLVADVRRVATRVAGEKGYAAPRLVATGVERPAGGADLTAAVMSLLSQGPGR